MAQLNWIGKTYKILWNHFHNLEWRIEDAEKILSDRPRETIRNIISRLSKEGLLSIRSDPDNTRRSIYKLNPLRNDVQKSAVPFPKKQKMFAEECSEGIASLQARREMKKWAVEEENIVLENIPSLYEFNADHMNYYLSTSAPAEMVLNKKEPVSLVGDAVISIIRLFHDTVENVHDFNRMIEFLWLKKQVEIESLLHGLSFRDLFFYENNPALVNFARVVESRIPLQLNSEPSWKLISFCENLSETIQRRGTYGSRYLLHILEHFFSGPPAKLDYSLFSEIITSLFPKISSSHLFTHPSIIELIMDIMRPSIGERFYDPACGYGQFLFAADYFLKDGSTNVNQQGGHFFGEIFIPELSKKNPLYRPYIVAMLANLLDITEIKLTLGDSLLHPAFAEEEKLKTFSMALTSPPAYIRGYDEESLKKGDIWWRFRFGFPGKRSSEWAFVQHTFASLEIGGKAAIVLPGDSITRRGPDKEIRTRLISEGCIDCIVLLPTELTPVKDSSVILILKRNRKGSGREDVLFIDSRKECEKQWDDSGIVTITSEHVRKIADIYINRTSLPDLSRTVPVQELLDDDGNLSVPFYVNPEKESEPDTDKTGWETRRLGDISTGATAGLTVGGSLSGNEYRSLTALAISKEGTILSSRLKKTRILDITLKDQYLLQKNDIVIVVRDSKKGRGMIKKTLLYNGLPRDLVFSSDVWRIRVTSPDILPEFLYLVLNMYKNKRFSFSVQEFSEKNRMLYVPCPAISHQKDIIEAFRKNPSLSEFIEACIKPFMADMPSSR